MIHEKLMFCDNEGVPFLVQKITYQYGSMMLRVWFFNGECREFASDWFVPSIGLMQHHITNMQWLEALQRIEQHVLVQYQTMWPELVKEHGGKV